MTPKEAYKEAEFRALSEKYPGYFDGMLPKSITDGSTVAMPYNTQTITGSTYDSSYYDKQKIEKIISKDANYSLRYVRNISQTRLKSAEDLIFKDCENAFEYLKLLYHSSNVPEDLHNKMLGLALNNPNNYYIKEYFKRMANKLI